MGIYTVYYTDGFGVVIICCCCTRQVFPAFPRHRQVVGFATCVSRGIVTKPLMFIVATAPPPTCQHHARLFTPALLPLSHHKSYHGTSHRENVQRFHIIHHITVHLKSIQADHMKSYCMCHKKCSIAIFLLFWPPIHKKIHSVA